MNIPEEAIEAAAQAMFAEEQCDRLQKLHVEENWQGRLNDGDRNEYRAFARAALEAAAPILLKNMRPMSLVEIEERDNPELMKAARDRVRAEAKAYRAEQIAAAKVKAWDEGFTARSHEGIKQQQDPSYPIHRNNPYRKESPDA